MKPAVILLLLPFGSSLSSLSAVAQRRPSVPQSPAITFHSSSNLVLVDVFALNTRNGRSDEAFKRDDFQIFDDGHPVSIATFDSGPTTRPLALWFVVQCNMQDFETHGSGFFRGQIGRFKPALKDLDKQDTVAVAHWCDNGDSKLDLLPTPNVDEAVTTLERVLAPTMEAEDHDRTGELALQRTLQLIVDATRPLVPERLPVVIFLYGDHSGMPRSEADRLVDALLETSAVAYGLKDSRCPGVWFVPGEQKEVAHYIAAQTGGRYSVVTPETYATGLEEILRQLHFRYELGFKPEALDGKRHKLSVKLADAGKNQHRGVRLRYRTAYVPVASR